jgi:hypothetical protein
MIPTEEIAPPVVYLVMTDGPGCGGNVFCVKASMAEAETAMSKLPGDRAFIVPWTIGSEMWDEEFIANRMKIKSQIGRDPS